MIEKNCPRKTKLKAFKKVEARAVARHDLALKYDAEAGYLGTEVSGEKLLEASKFDKILILRNNGIYTIIPLPDKFFAGQKILWTAIATKESLSKTTITLIYSLSNENGAYIKRTIIDSWLTGRDYSLVPETAVILGFSTENEFDFKLEYKPKSRSKKTSEVFHVKQYAVRNRAAQGIKLTDREVIKFEMLSSQKSETKREQKELAPSKSPVSKKKTNKKAKEKKETAPSELTSGGLLKAAIQKQKKET
jgi:topoisomerase-4 subunit A